MNNINELKQAYLQATEEYNLSFASGDSARLLQALKNHNAAFNAYNKAKKKEFKKTYKYVAG